LEARKQKLPTRAGARWDSQEDRVISAAFSGGKDVTIIAKLQERTRGSIQSRLVKLELIQLAPDIETIEELISGSTDFFRINV